MNISYSLPLSNAWRRMKKALFQPFDLNKWLRIGFTAFLAGLVDCQGGNGGHYSRDRHFHWDEFFRFPHTAWDWLGNHPVWFNLIIFGLIVIFIIITVLIWLSSRGKFMFLHNVANDNSEISKPWNEYSRQGNSLFIFRFLLGWLAFAIIIGLFVLGFLKAKDLYYGGFHGVVIFWNIVVMALIFIAITIIFSYISLFMDHFVVPIMYKNKSGITSGWIKFLKLFGSYPLTLIVYGLFILVLYIVAVIAVIFFALCTCCIGLILLIIPYIGSVVLLPVSYLFRALSIEFLAQFGEEYDVFPKAVDPPQTPPFSE